MKIASKGEIISVGLGESAFLSGKGPGDYELKNNDGNQVMQSGKFKGTK